MTRVALGNPLGTPRIGLGSPLGVGRVGILGFSSAAKVVSRATAYWKASRYDAANDRLTDLSGNGHHARLGSAVGADTNDPLRLVHAGNQHLYQPGVLGNHPSTPGKAAFDTEDLDVAIRLTPTSWASGALQYLASVASTGSSGQYRWTIRLTATGLFEFVWSTDVQGVVAQSSAVVPFAVGETGWLRITVDYNPGGNYSVTFYTSTDETNDPDEVVWMQLGVAQTGAQVGGSRPTLRELLVGRLAVASSVGMYDGKVHSFVLRDGIDGAVVATLDPSDTDALAEPFADYTDPQGNLWTLNRSASGRKLAVVDRTLLLFGTDDYLWVAHHSDLHRLAGTGYTVVAVYRDYGNGVGTLLSRTVGTGTSPANLDEWILSRQLGDAVRFYTRDATVEPSDASGHPRGSLAWTAGRLAADNTQVAIANGTVAGARTQPGALEGSRPLDIGRSGGGGAYFDGELVAAAIFREGLSDADLVKVAAELKAA